MKNQLIKMMSLIFKGLLVSGAVYGACSVFEYCLSNVDKVINNLDIYTIYILISLLIILSIVNNIQNIIEDKERRKYNYKQQIKRN